MGEYLHRLVPTISFCIFVNSLTEAKSLVLINVLNFQLEIS